jgi:hypothetical protein
VETHTGHFVQCLVCGTKCGTKLYFVKLSTADLSASHPILHTIHVHVSLDGVISLEFIRFGTATGLYKYIDKYV